MKTIHFSRYLPETELITCQQLMSRIALKITSNVITPQKAHPRHLRHVSVQYENNPANAFRDIVREMEVHEHPPSKKLVKDHYPKKAHPYPLRETCVYNINNPANGFRDIVRK